ncbi:helix-turn-helix transcriptional regulator [Pseudarthrobacter sp. LT1]|uniref:helix-turn-helix domain-containing protein n=1 Tax=Pseudarthrobacter sp. LT1 TaxID=3111450 RepID=UPI002D764BD5|nr:helix-turn-helix transcriptional regulator [Pseudarthrobacter sp. LT1]WRT14700.1 helix-turn-helix transcriptional regulator [Pseudarthrobacter sp. LT1]
MAKTTAGKQPPNHTEIDLINQVLADKGVSKNSLADQTNIPFKTLCRRLDGDGLLTLKELRKIASALGVWPSEILPEELTTKQDAA